MDKFKDIIRQTIDAIEQFAAIEQTKLEAAAEANLTALEDCMTKEQAMILRIKGLEQERMKWQRQNGREGLSFREMLEQETPEQREELQPLYDRLSKCINLFQDISKSAEQIIKTNLYVVNRKLEQRGTEYNKDGSTETPAEGHLTDSKA